jgi:beta-phosphoglucomutase-like phosphatase (HAD superfamily)
VLRALLLDFNGVLVDDEPLHFRLLLRVLAEEGVSVEGDADPRRFLGRDDRACLVEALGSAAGAVPEERLVRLIARKAAYYQDEVRRHGYPLFPGACELVRSGAAAGLLLGVVSGALRDEVDGALAQAGLDPLLRVRVTAEDVARGKPDPEGYLRALAELNAGPPLPARLIHPHEVAAVEDSPAGLEAAGAAGLRTIGFSPGGLELPGAERVVTSLAELTPAWLARNLDPG